MSTEAYSTSCLDSFLEVEEETGEMLQQGECSYLPKLPLDRQLPSYVLSRRRYAISNDDEQAEKNRQIDSILPDWPLQEFKKYVMAQRQGRRGSLQNHSQTSSSKLYKNVVQHGSVLDKIGVDEHSIGIQLKLATADTWDFDIFAFRRITQGKPLYYLGMYLFKRHGLIDHFRLDMLKLHKFLTMVEDAYHPLNPYHNSTHAADVAQALHCLLLEPAIYCYLSPLDILTAIIAALCHDLDHPGYSQSYLVNTNSHLAALHHNNSVLEKHHTQTAKGYIFESQLLDHLDNNIKQAILGLMEKLILSTDVTKHKEFVEEFQKMTEQPIDLSDSNIKHFIFQIAMKAADISNPTRTLNLSRKWSELIMEEFFSQGDEEKKRNLPVTNLCDRDTIHVPKCQSCFFEYMALPLFQAWCQFVPSRLSIQMCHNVITNKSYWDSLVMQEEADNEY